nr:CHAD domain-containing protein [Phytoactinopolyspora alkaliphila]
MELDERKGGKAAGRVAAALTGAGAVGGEFVAKVVRALGPAATSPPEVPDPAEPGPDDPAADTVTAYLAVQIRALRKADLAFRWAPESSEDAVHRMRVAARRLRGALRTFRPLLDSGRTVHLASELAWFARGLNELRNNDVLRARLIAHSAHLPEEVPSGPVNAFVEAALTADAAEAHAYALAILDSRRYLRLHDELVAAVHDPSFGGESGGSARDVLPALAHKVWKRLRASADSLRENAPAQEWHRVRLHAKRARYAAEAVAMSLGDDAAAFAREMRKLTDILGEHEDAHQAIDALHLLARRPPADAEIVFALGALATVEKDHALRARVRFTDAWSRTRRVGAPRTWTGG